MRTLLLVLCLSLAASSIKVQSTPSWTQELANPIQWERVTPLGNLMVYTTVGLHGLDPETGEVIWHIPFDNLDQTKYTVVEGSPYVQLGTTAGDYLLLDPFEGQLLFNSKTANLRSVDFQQVLYGSQLLVVQGELPSGNLGLVVADMQSGEVKWKLDQDFGKVRTVRELAGGDFLVATLFKIYRYSPNSSEPKWEAVADPEMAAAMDSPLGGLMMAAAKSMGADQAEVKLRLFPSPNPNTYYVASHAKQPAGEVNGEQQYKDVGTVYALNVETGKPRWGSKYEFEGMLPLLISLPSGVVVCPGGDDNTRVNLLDHATGQPQWGKKGRGEKVKGAVLDYAITDQGLLIATGKESDWRNNSSKLYLDMLNPATGESVFNKREKVNGSFEFLKQLDAKRLLYATDREVNILNLNTGENMLRKSLATGSGLYEEEEGQFYVCDPDKLELHVIDLNTNVVRELFTDKLKFEGREDPSMMEVRQSGVLIHSAQNAALIGKDGALKYHQYVEAPREPGITRALAVANSVLMTYEAARSEAAAAQFKAASQQTDSELGQSLGGELAQAFEQRGDQAMSYAKEAMQVARARYKASAVGADHLYMLKREDNKQVGLVRLNKDSGQVTETIPLGKDREPVYELDQVSNRLFYKAESNKLVGYQF